MYCPATGLVRVLSLKARGCNHTCFKRYVSQHVARAYFYAFAIRPVYVQIAAEDMNPGDEGLVGRLDMSMYGTRVAAANWAAECGATLVAAGYV